MKTRLAALALALSAPAFAVDLPAALRGAQAADPSLSAAAANRDAAQEYVPISKARLLPQVSFQGSYQRIDQNIDRSGAVTNFIGPSHNLQLQLRQPVYRMRDWVGFDIGKLQALQGEQKFVSAQSDLWNRTVSAWSDVLTAQALRDLYAQTVPAVARAAEQERRRFEEGDGTRDAVVEAEAQLALARSQLAEATVDLQSRLRAFNLLTRLGVGGFEGFRLPPPSALSPFPESEKDFLARVLDSNADLASARSLERIGERRVAQSAADHRPTLDLVVSASNSASDTVSTLNTRYKTNQIGLQLAVPIYSGGAVSASERQASSSYSAAQSDREALEQKITTQFTLDWNAQAAQRERLQALAGLADAAREQRLAAELGVKAGLRTWADVAVAEQSIARRQADLIRGIDGFVKLQSRLLSLLPVDDSAWGRWIAAVSAQARR